jgi:hypothetical protein
MLNIQTKSNKDVLARLMATENLNVIHKSVPTAYFDVKSRTLCCPILKEELSPELTDLFMGHEVGHALNTPAEGWHDAVSEKGMTFKGYLNVIEDIRIEKKIKDKYPGLRRSFFTGYNELGQRDFFGLNERKQDINDLGFIDRINLHYKLGAQAQVKFSDEEMVYIKRCDSLETFKEVMELAIELFETKQEETQTMLDGLTDEELKQLMEDMDIEQEDGTGSMTVETEKSDEDSDQEGSDAKAESDEDSEESDEDSKSDETDGSGNGDQEEDSDKKGGKSPEEQLKDKMNKSETDESFREKEGSLLKNEDSYYNEPAYYDLPGKIKYSEYIIGYKKIQEQLEGQFNREYIKKYVKTFTDNNKKIVNYMVKEFEMKKAAAAYNRSHGAKSGELNMDKLALYKLKDDIFNRVQVTPEGKNHGVVMAVDWSGSMSGTVRSTVEQAALLAMFCKRINIPFRVFAFSDSYNTGIRGQLPDYIHKEENQSKRRRLQREWMQDRMFGKSTKTPQDFETWSLGGVALLEMLSDKMSNSDFIKALENWFQVAHSTDNPYQCYDNYKSGWNYDQDYYVTDGFHLGGTPLDHTIVIMRDYLTEFKAQYGIDIMSFIALTDGSSHSVFERGNSELVDRKFNKTVIFKGNNTSTLLKWLKETAGVRTIGFYLSNATGNHFKYDAASFSGTKMDTWTDEFEKKRKEFTKISTSFDDGHYDLSIIINQKKLNINYDEDVLQVQDDATKGQLKNALVKAGNNKMKQRVILNQFVQQMAV